MQRRKYIKLIGGVATANTVALVGSAAGKQDRKKERQTFQTGQKIAQNRGDQAMIDYLLNRGFELNKRYTTSRPFTEGPSVQKAESSDLNLSCNIFQGSSGTVYADSNFEIVKEEDSFGDPDEGSAPRDVISIGWESSDYDRADTAHPGNPNSTGAVGETLEESYSGIAWEVHDDDKGGWGNNEGDVLWSGTVSCELTPESGTTESERRAQAEYMHNWTSNECTTTVGVSFSSSGDMGISYSVQCDTTIEEWNDTEKAYDSNE
jgi:hypothetical protein